MWVAACTAEVETGEAVFTLPRAGLPEGDFFDLPWPTELRRTADGHIDVRAFPNPSRVDTLDDYLSAMSTHLDGWGTNGAAYFRFTESVDASTLPASTAETVEPGASVFIIDVDPASPERGRRRPAVVVYRDEETIFWRAHTIAIRPVHGIPLASRRLYAAVVTRDARPQGGGRFGRSKDLDAVLAGSGGDDAVARARDVYGPAVTEIESAGVERDDIVSLAVFRTQDATGELVAMRDWMMSSYTEPEAIEPAWERVDQTDLFVQAAGRYAPAPTFQRGPSPYEEPGSGGFTVEGGVPVVDSEYEARFTLTIPFTDMPDAGYPIVLYAHGTGGDHTSFVNDGTAGELASVGYAAMGIDQVLHGERNPGMTSPDYLFFNFLNPLAARDNARQGVLDVVQQARFVPNAVVPTSVAARRGMPVRFDPSRVYVFGHSQGGLNMPVFLAIDDQARGGVLSGAAATLLIALVEKTEPLDIRLAVQILLRLPGGSPAVAAEREHLVFEHPVLSLLQTWVDAADASNYGRMIHAEPRPGFAPKSVLQTEGLMDLYSTPNGIESLAAAIGNPLLDPVARPIDALTARGLAPMAPPVSGNVAGGAATAGLLQFPDNGHFAVFENEIAQAQIRGFFDSFWSGPVPVIPAP